jgi:hypothetical protein
MADISKCEGTGCPHKEKCYRFTATADEYRQSYFVMVPFVEEDGEIKCDHFWGAQGETVWTKSAQAKTRKTD